jgi:hypothetical protein
MISGTFHPLAQEWRYYSREKSLMQTLHVAQMPSSNAGDTVLVMNTKDVTTNSKGYGFHAMPFPSGPSFISNINRVTNSSMHITCYGSVGTGGTILAQSKMSISVAGVSQIIMSPQESGFFVVHAEAYSDIHHTGAEGTGGKITINITGGGQLVAKAEAEIKEQGTQWTDPAIDLDFFRRLACGCTGLAAGGSFVANSTGLGGDSAFTMWCMKVADYG